MPFTPTNTEGNEGLFFADQNSSDDDAKQEIRNKSREGLLLAEKQSAKPKRHDYNSLRAQEKEENNTNLGLNPNFRSAVNGRSNTKAKGQAKHKSFSPAVTFATAIIAFCFFLIAPMSLSGANILANITRHTDIQHATMRNRSVTITKHQMKKGKISKRMHRRLQKYDIEVGKLDANNNFTTKITDDNRNSPDVFKYKDKYITAKELPKAMEDPEFSSSFHRAKRDRIAAFTDSRTMQYIKKHPNQSRHRSNIATTGDNEVDTKNYQELVYKTTPKADFNANSTHLGKDQDGNDKKDPNGEDITIGNTSGQTPKAKAHDFVNKVAKQAVKDSPNLICQAAMTVSGITAIKLAATREIAASNTYLNLEILSQNKSGINTAPANQVLNNLNEKVTTKVSYIDDQGNAAEREVTGSALEAEGMRSMLTGANVNPADVADYANDNSQKALNKFAAVTGSSLAVCSGVTIASSIISASTSLVPGGTTAKVIFNTFIQSLPSVALTVAASPILYVLADSFVNFFVEDVDDFMLNFKGIPGGNSFANGAYIANSRIAQNGSAYMPSSPERASEQNQQLHAVLQTESTEKRLDAKPFDPRNPDSFLGNILMKFSTFGASSPNVKIATILNALTQSIASLSPMASASSAEQLYTSNQQNCTNLPGASCDIYGNPLLGSDASTADIDPDDPVYQSVIKPNLKADGKSIRDNSELAKFVNFCVNRESPWGVQDANILNALQSDAGIIVNNIPIVEDLIDVVNAVENLANKKWATGENCINSKDNPRWDNEFKYYQRFVEDMRIYTILGEDPHGEKQDQTTVSSSTKDGSIFDGDFDVNPVVAYENEYYAAHPLDNSPEGVLARISGYTKQDIAYLLESAKELKYLARYQMQDKYLFGASMAAAEPIIPRVQPDQKPHTIFDKQLKVAYQTIFLDRRNYTL